MPALSLQAAAFSRLAEADADVLNGMMGIDVQIAGRLSVQVEQSVPRQQREHVIEKPDPRRNAGRPRCRRAKTVNSTDVSPVWAAYRSCDAPAPREAPPADDAGDGPFYSASLRCLRKPRDSQTRLKLGQQTVDLRVVCRQRRCVVRRRSRDRRHVADEYPPPF